MVHDSHYQYDRQGNILLGENGEPLFDEDAIIEAAAWGKRHGQRHPL